MGPTRAVITNREIQSRVFKEVSRIMKLQVDRLESHPERVKELDLPTDSDVRKLKDDIRNVKQEGKATASYMSKLVAEKPPSGDQAVKKRRPREPSPPALQSPAPAAPLTAGNPHIAKEQNGTLPREVAAKNVQRELHQAESVMSSERTIRAPSPAENGHGSSTTTAPAPTGTTRRKATAEGSQASAEGSKAAAERRKATVAPSPTEQVVHLPPLPPTTCPSVLPGEAASFSIPPKLKLSLSYIQNPPNIGLTWAAEGDKPPPTMNSYIVYYSFEKKDGYSNWAILNELRAIELPMAAMIPRQKTMSRWRLCFIVVGKDTFGRYGPYSNIAHTILPQDSFFDQSG